MGNNNKKNISLATIAVVVSIAAVNSKSDLSKKLSDKSSIIKEYLKIKNDSEKEQKFLLAGPNCFFLNDNGSDNS